MKKTSHWGWLPAVLAAACLLSPLPAGAAQVPDQPAGPEQNVRQDAAPAGRQPAEFGGLPNCRTERLARYAAWAELHPELDLETVVFQVNLDLDRAFYDTPQGISDPASLSVLVNKHNVLPEDYVPELEVLGADYGSGSLRPEAAQAFRAMADAAREEGVVLRSVSAYRSYSHQASTYHRYLRQYSQKTVDTFSARPGHSEHQTGLALDINAASKRAHFENTPAFAWLVEHCAEYGFVLRYDQGKEAVTGYRFEPWHYRYVGTEAAQACMEQGLSYEEYLALQTTEGEGPREVVPDWEPAAESEPLPFPIFAGTPVEV